jgi:hypothetical protein
MTLTSIYPALVISSWSASLLTMKAPFFRNVGNPDTASHPTTTYTTLRTSDLAFSCDVPTPAIYFSRLQLCIFQLFFHANIFMAVLFAKL